MSSDIRERFTKGNIAWNDVFDALKRYINTGNRQELRKYLESMIQGFIIEGYQLECMEHTLKQTVLSLQEILYGAGAGELVHNKRIYEEFQEKEMVSDYIEWILKISEEIIKRNERRKELGKSDLIKRVVQYIEHNIGESFTINSVAEKFFISVSLLGRLFKEEVGMTFTDFVIQTKMELAEKLLKEGKNVATISERLGYCNSQYFIKQFKERYGATPRYYQFQQKEQEVEKRITS